MTTDEICLDCDRENADCTCNQAPSLTQLTEYARRDLDAQHVRDAAPLLLDALIQCMLLIYGTANLTLFTEEAKAALELGHNAIRKAAGR